MDTQEKKIIKHRAFILFSIVAGSLFIIAVGVRVLKAFDESSIASVPPTVAIAPLSSFKQEKVLVINNGIVESLTQAELRSQTSAPVSNIKVRVGQEVEAGKVLVTLSNTDVSAQLKQAQAALAMQRAVLAGLISGASPEDIALSYTDLAQAQEGFLAHYANALILINDAYVKTSDAVIKQISGLLLNDDTPFPQLSFTTNNAQAAIDATVLRVQVQKDLTKWREEIDSLTPTDRRQIDSALVQVKTRLATALSFLNKLDDALADAGGVSGGSVAARANVNAARGILNALSSMVTAQAQSIANARFAVDRAQQGLALKKAGGTVAQREAQEAVVAQAEAGVATLSAQLEKTIIRSPISGKVASLPVRIGELISPGQLVSSIVNTNSLQVKTFVSEADLSIVREGDEALVNNLVSGRVFRVAPSVDPQTKKVSVDIIITDEHQTTLVVGQTVDVTIKAQKLQATQNSYLVPLSAVRISSNGSYLFEVVDNRVKEMPVQTGDLMGESVVVFGSLSPSTEIITIARGIKAEEIVKVVRQ